MGALQLGQLSSCLFYRPPGKNLSGVQGIAGQVKLLEGQRQFGTPQHHCLRARLL